MMNIVVEMLEDERLKKIRLNNLPPHILQILQKSLKENEMPLLIVKEDSEFWVFTDLLRFINLHTTVNIHTTVTFKSHIPYELSNAYAIGLFDFPGFKKQVEFGYKDRKVCIPGGLTLLNWLQKYNIRPKYDTPVVKIVRDSISDTPWVELDFSIRERIERALNEGELPVLLISPYLLCTDSYIIDLKSKPAYRYDPRNISDLRWGRGFSESSTKFTCGDKKVVIPADNYGTVFMMLMDRWPYMGKRQVVQDLELKGADIKDLKLFTFGCRMSAIDSTGALESFLGQTKTTLTYTKASCHILTKHPTGNHEYYQIIICPRCRSRLLLKIKNGKSAIILSSPAMCFSVNAGRVRTSVDERYATHITLRE